MADKTPELPPIVQKVILQLEETMKGVNFKSNDILKDFAAKSEDATKSTKSFGLASKMAGGLLGQFAKGATLGVSVVTELAATVAKFTIEIAKSQKEYLDFTRNVGDSARVFDNLNKAYFNVNTSASSLLVSMRDIAKSAQDFAQSGFAQQLLAGNTKFLEATGKLQNTISNQLGPEAGQAITQQILSVFKNNLPALESVIKNIDLGTPEGIDRLQQVLASMGPEAATLALQLNKIKTPLDDSISPMVQLEKIGKRLSNIWVAIQDTLAKFIGPTLKGMLGWIDGLVQKLERGVFGKLAAVAKWLGFMDLADNLEKAGNKMQDDAEKIGQGVGDNISQGIKKSHVDVKSLNEVTKYLQSLETYSKGIGDTTGAMSSVGKSIELMGANAEIAGIGVQELFQNINKAANLQISGEQAKELGENINKAFANLKGQVQDLEDAKKSIAGLVVGGKEYTAAQSEVSRLENVIGERSKDLNKLLQARLQIIEAMKQKFEGALKPLEKSLVLISKQKSLQESQLNISQQLYGTPALAVENQLKVVELAQKEKENLQDQLKLARDNIKQMEAQGAKSEDLQFAKEKELDLQKQIADKTAEQLGMLKKLRDGYLDAVQAQAFGAGKFEKIIVTQEKNLLRGLEARTIKENYLLGQYNKQGEALKSLRFNSEGLGAMSTGGIGLDEEAAIRRQQQIQSTAFTDKDRKILEAANSVTRDASDMIYQSTRAAAAGAALKPGMPATQTGLGAGASKASRNNGIVKTTGDSGSPLGICKQLAQNMDQQKQLILVLGGYLNNELSSITQNASATQRTSNTERSVFN